MQIGYVRGRSGRGKNKGQIEALENAGCARVVVEPYVKGSRALPELTKVVEEVEAGDCLVVFSLSNFSLSLNQLVYTIGKLSEKDVGFKSLNDKLSTTGMRGQDVRRVLEILYGFEQAHLSQKVKEGLLVASTEGRHGGRPPRVGEKELAQARDLLSRKWTREKIARKLRVSRMTLYRAMRNGT